MNKKHLPYEIEAFRPRRQSRFNLYCGYAVCVLVALVLVASLVGCTAQTGESNLARPNHAGDPYVYRDTETGCEYLSPNGNGITPRMDRTGKQICREVVR